MTMKKALVVSLLNTRGVLEELLDEERRKS